MPFSKKKDIFLLWKKFSGEIYNIVKYDILSLLSVLITPFFFEKPLF